MNLKAVSVALTNALVARVTGGIADENRWRAGSQRSSGGKAKNVKTGGKGKRE